MAYLKDVDGNEIYVRMSIGALRRFEQRSKIDFFDKFQEAVTQIEELQKQGSVNDAKLITELIKGIFPNLDAIAGFLFECTVFAKDQPKPDFEEYCDRLPATILLSSARLIWEEIQRFMPAPPSDDSPKEDSGPKGQ